MRGDDDVVIDADGLQHGPLRRASPTTSRASVRVGRVERASREAEHLAIAA